MLKDIQELAKTALKDADAFYQRLSSRMERRYLVDASQTEKERKRLEARNQEIDGMFLSLYTDKAKGILTEQRFMKLTATLEQEQEANQKRLQDLMLMMRHSDEQENEVRTFIKEIRRYATIEELDEAVLNRLISKILVSEVKKIDGQKVQEVRIIYNFVGEISVKTAGGAVCAFCHTAYFRYNRFTRGKRHKSVSVAVANAMTKTRKVIFVSVIIGYSAYACTAVTHPSAYEIIAGRVFYRSYLFCKRFVVTL